MGLQSAGPPHAGAGRVAVQGSGIGTFADSQALYSPGQRRPRESVEGSSSDDGRDEEIESEIESKDEDGPSAAKRPRVGSGAGPRHWHVDSVPKPMQVARETRDCNGHSVVIESAVLLDPTAGAEPVTSAPHAQVDGCAADPRPDSISSDKDDDDDEDEDEDEVEETSTCPTPRMPSLEEGRRRLDCVRKLGEIHKEWLAQVQSLPLSQAEAVTEQLCAGSWGAASGGCGGS